VNEKLLAALRAATPAPLRPALGKLRRAMFPPPPPTPASAPPQAMMALVGAADADFVRVGQEYRALLTGCGMQPHHRLLDVGCGIGRAAGGLIGFFDTGFYRGFDVMPDAIAWCRENITAKDTRFEFVHADLHSDRYNPGGSTPANKYVFPYPDASFDFVFLGSVFTHLLAADQAQFAREIARVLKPGGTSVISWYLLDDVGRANLGSGVSAWEFAHALDGCWTATPELPEAVLAFDRDAMMAQYDALGFDAEVRPGVWRTQAIQDQDIVVARKRA
jgi:SAM-dependent methyltransferase